MADSDGFFIGEILGLIFENDLGKNLDKTFDGEFFNLIFYLQKKHVQRIIFQSFHNFIDYLNNLYFGKETLFDTKACLVSFIEKGIGTSFKALQFTFTIQVNHCNLLFVFTAPEEWEI